MANHKSALKRMRQNERRRLRNKSMRTHTKTAVKSVRQAAAEGSAELVLEKLNSAKSIICKAAQKGALHKRTAARKVSRLTKLANKISL